VNYEQQKKYSSDDIGEGDSMRREFLNEDNG
jgi:hypothetical protein